MFADNEVPVFYGRKAELDLLQKSYNSKTGNLVVIYGRRRIGKSTLVKHFAKSKRILLFEGLESENTQVQISHFSNLLKKQFKENTLLQKAQFRTWSEIFDYLTEYSKQNQENKLILFFDEFQWMAASQSKLVSLVKYYWDNHWKDLNLMLVLCGSIASFMVKKVLRSKALYGRISLELRVGKLSPSEAKKIISKRGDIEALKYLMLLGGVPKYLEMVDTSMSFEQNIQKMFFSTHPLLNHEFEKIFYSHFREPKIYLKIMEYLLTRPMTLDEISKKMKMISGGGLKSYLENLELADFVRQEVPLLSSENTKLKKYRISDEYLAFFAKYIHPHEKMITRGGGANLFRNQIYKKWDPWMGLSFEMYCLNNAIFIAEKMNFAGYIEDYGPYFKKGAEGFQIDLLFKRSDKVITLCELKYHSEPISTKVIPEVKRKAELFPLPKGYTLELALIAPSGAERALKDTEYFHHILTLPDLL